MKYILFLVIFLNILDAKDYTIGFSQNTLQNDWIVAQANEVKNEISKHKNLKLIVKNAQGKVSNQIRHLEEFIKTNVDFIIVCPLNAQITPLVLKKAIKKNIKVILLSRGINSDDYTSFITGSNRLIAQKSAKYLAKKINYKGTILMLQGVQGASSSIQREEGFDNIIKNYPLINVIKRRANYMRNDAIKVMEELYKNNIKFDAIYAQSDSMLIGAREVIKRHKNKIDFPTTSIDYIKETKSALLNEEQTASFLYPTAAKEGVQTIIDIINNKKIQKNVILDTIMITKENAKEIEPIF